MLVGELLVEKWKAVLYSFVCAKTIFVNGMTLSTEFNKSHICVCVCVCVWQKRECCSREGNNLVFRRCYLLFLRRNRQPSFEKSSTTALIRSG